MKRMHTYYLKNMSIMETKVKNNSSWIMKFILKQRDCIQNLQSYKDMLEIQKFSMRKMYKMLHSSIQRVDWRTLFYGNMERPRALITLWIAFHERLATKARLHKML